MRLNIAVALVTLAVQLAAQSPAAPTDLKIVPDSNGVKLTWAAVPGNGIRYLIERGGPGFTFYTQIGGPVSESSFVIHEPEFDRCKERDGYTYRVRTVDSASITSAASNVVSAIPGPVCNLPLVGNNILDLIAMLPGANIPGTLRSTESVSFYLTGVRERTVSFSSADLSQSFSWGCADCSFIVGPDGVSASSSNNRGVAFRLSADGGNVVATCRAVKCEATSAAKTYTLASGGSVTLPTSSRIFFTFSTVNSR